jgi:hypothetical protein
MAKSTPKTANFRELCRQLGIDPRKARLVARIAKECGLKACPKRVSPEIRQILIDQVAARGQNRLTQKLLDGDDAGTTTGAPSITVTSSAASSPRPSRSRGTDTTLAEEKLRKTIAERELLELRADRNRRALLRLFTERSITPHLKIAFAPLSAFLLAKLPRHDVVEWNRLCDCGMVEFETALKEDADNWTD